MKEINIEEIKSLSFYNKILDTEEYYKRNNVNQCRHVSLKLPDFDSDKSKGKGTGWIRKHYPRSVEKCPDCGCAVIMYASKEHYILGDW